MVQVLTEDVAAAIPPSVRDQSAVFISLIFVAPRRNPATCGSSPGARKGRKKCSHLTAGGGMVQVLKEDVAAAEKESQLIQKIVNLLFTITN